MAGSAYKIQGDKVKAIFDSDKADELRRAAHWPAASKYVIEQPNEFVQEIHTRMPVILPEEHHDAWLSGGAGKKVLFPYPADRNEGVAGQFSCK
jgi:putative SOS response-associated peptidase YedK